MMVLNARSEHRLSVDGITINVPTMDQAVASIVAAARERRSFSVCTMNLDHVVHLHARNDAFRSAYHRARFVTADGFPIVVLGRLAKAPIRRTTGADLVEPICEEASRQGLPVFLLGSNETTLKETTRRLRERFRGLEIAGQHSPGPGFDPFSAEADDAIERLRASGAPLCFVALGSPKQEIFANRCLDKVGSGLLCVGAALDFIAGTQARAPRLAQRTGLEWFWRMSRNPRRFAPRYARCVAALPWLLADTIPQIIDARMGMLKWRQ
jgi:N-acetylglucosaminyldiphosphoundecaprenol N-acetyl-beta-D-mannosaminyltransferase